MFSTSHVGFRPFSFTIQKEAEKNIYTHLSNGKIEEAIAVLPSLNLYNYLPTVNKIIETQLAKGDFVGAIKIASTVLDTNTFNLIADSLQKAKIDPETLAKVEKEAETLFSPFKKIILEALVLIYKAMGDTKEVTRLEEKISHIKPLEILSPEARSVLSVVTAFYTGLIHYYFRSNAKEALTIGLVSGVTSKYPNLRKIENMVGIESYFLASVAGVGTLPSVGIGISTAFVARIPLVQKIAKQAGIVTGKAASFAIEKTATGVVIAADKVAEGAEFVAEKTVKILDSGFDLISRGVESLENLGPMIVDRSLNIAAAAGKALFSATDLAIQTTGKAISGLNAVLDYPFTASK